jgi:hypothetical protein
VVSVVPLRAGGVEFNGKKIREKAGNNKPSAPQHHHHVFLSSTHYDKSIEQQQVRRAPVAHTIVLDVSTIAIPYYSIGIIDNTLSPLCAEPQC